MAVRRSLFALLFAFAAAASWLALPVSADEEEEKNPKAKPAKAEKGQPPKGEEEDTKKGKPKKIDVDDGPPMPKPPGTTPTTPMPPGEPSGPEPPSETPDKSGVYLAKFDDLARAATSARHAALRDYYRMFSVAFDRLTDRSGKPVRITPVPPRWQYDKFPPEFGISVLDDTNAASEPESMAKAQVRRIDHFELIAIEETDKLLKLSPADGPSPADRLEAAETVLSKVLFFHDSAREQERRRGKNWEAVKAQLYDKLTEVRLERLRQTGAAGDWSKQATLFKRAAELYKANPKVLEQVYASRLAQAELLVKSKNVADLETGRRLLNEYDARFPSSGNEQAKRVRQSLADQAKVFIGDAQRLIDTDPAAARKLIDAAGVIDPGNLSLRPLQNQAKAYATLLVGARRMPVRMSPALARFDSEKQAVELLFEGLLEALPDEQLGVRFQLALAADRPGVGAGVRDVNLIRSAEWAGTERGVFDASDVASTLRLMRVRPTSWAADPVTWLDETGFDPSDPGRVRMRFRLGHPDPRSLLTLKLHPANWLLQKNKQIDDMEFALHPFGTGPFRLADGYKPAGPNDKVSEVVFVANPAYARRPGKMGQPFIKEVRFVDVSDATNLPSAFRGGRLHILTDVATRDLPQFTAENNLGGTVRVVTPKENRRIHILAINHRRPALQNPDLRRGLMHAIDRERILTDVYRDTQADAHKALSGPFPVASWATPRAAGAGGTGLYNRDTAQGRLRAYLSSPQSIPALRLAYAADDPLARTACDRIKTMIESALATEDRKLTISLEALAPRDLLTKVDELHDFDLAYVPFDYRDDWYPQALGSLLDPSANGPGGRNFTGYLSKEMSPSDADEKLGRALAEVRAHREPARLDRLAHDIHRKFNEAVPFVPLWQLDRHMVISTAVKLHFEGLAEEPSPRLLNPTTLFNSIGLWRVE